MDNANTKEYLDKIRRQVAENLKRTAFAPSVQMTDVPRDPLVGGMDDEADAILDDLDEDENKDKRVTKRRFDQYVEKPGELSDSEDEEENAANGIRRQPGAFRRRNQVNYRNLDVTDSGVDSGLATPREASSVAGDDMDTTMADAKMEDALDSTAVESHISSKPTSDPAGESTPIVEEKPAPESTEAVADQPEKIVSTPVSHHPSPFVQDQDITMEDAEAPVPEPEPGSAPQPAEPELALEKPQPESAEVPEKKLENAAPEAEMATGPTAVTTEAPSATKEVPKLTDIDEKAPEPSKEEPSPANAEGKPAKESTSEQHEEPIQRNEE